MGRIGFSKFHVSDVIFMLRVYDEIEQNKGSF